MLQGGSGKGEDSSSLLVLACAAKDIAHVTLTQLQCDRLGKPQSGARRTLMVQTRGADMVVSPSAPQVSICFGHFNCKVLR